MTKRAPPPAPVPDAQPRKMTVGRIGRLMDRILDAIARTDTGVPADRALREVFERARDLGSRERSQVGDVVFGVARRRRRIDDRLRRAAKAERRDFDVLDPPVQHRLRILSWLQDEGASLAELEAMDAYAFRRIPKLFARLGDDRLPPVKKRSEREALAIETSLPSWVVDRLADALGEARAAEIGRRLDGRAPVTLRVDPTRWTRDEALLQMKAAFEVEPELTPLSPLGLTLLDSIDLASWAPYQEGRVEVMDEGSQLIALAVRAQPGEHVLDACAGAGGKSLAISAALGGRGRLVAVDPDARKLAELSRRAKRGDPRRIETRALELETLPDDLRSAFDVVLVDAPCTGLGTLRRAPDLALRLEPSDLERAVARQKRLVASAVAALKPGGRLVYATCSVLWEENEDIARYLLREVPSLERAPLEEAWGAEVALHLGASWEARIGPGPGPRGPDGFYVASLRMR